MNLKELYSIAQKELAVLSHLENPDFRLEQAEYNEVDKTWDIVVSFLVENTNKPVKPFATLSVDFPFHRMYKKVKINEKKELVGVYIFNNKE